ncbi:hypothetical protein IEQ34_005338 [Dendrobium chrysotoxum]|uniref:Cohesin subunit SA-3 n=1 Tax=Dendrobium chrysotoxum TaxID=161865 RepID=A0AAV7HAT4_DENCH|nr:hypothetical protein IEQ34_005338 [Dendrobium chrysotoxum]
MENTGVTSEASVRRPQKKARVLEHSDGGPSKSSGSNPEKNDRIPADVEQLSGDDGDGDWLFDGAGNRSPKLRRKRGPSAKVVGAMEDWRLIEIIKYNSKLIPYAVKRLVEQYEADPKSAMVDILMLLFEACGAKYQFHVDTIESTDVDNVVVKLVELANACFRLNLCGYKGEVEDLYTSKRKELKNFKENLASFWDTLVLECQNGPLFDNILFEKCMDYVIALSCTPPRIYRYVATLVGLQLVTSLIAVAKILAGQRETTQRQLNAEKKKRSDGPRVESLNKRLTQTHKMISVIEEMMRKLFQGLFMHRYRDVDSDIRVSCIRSLGIWILSYPSLFLQDLYLKYLGWTLNDKIAAVRKTSVLSLQNLYEVDDNVPSLGLFTERFCNRMIELADDIDISVAVSAIGLLKLLLRHQLLTDEELGPLYDLLVDEPPMIRRAIGELVYDHLIAQNVKGSSSSSKGEDDKTSEVHLGRMLQILREFPDDPILSAYVIDDVWDDMKAMKDWKCMISMLLDETPAIEVTDVDATNLVRLLNASAKKAVGEKIVPSTDNRKPHYTKAQKEAIDNNRREITAALMKSYPQLLQKYIADKAKLPSLVEILLLLNLELYSLKRREQSFKSVLDLIAEAFFKHGEEDALKSCIKAFSFCSTESQADLRDYAQNKLKDIENELLDKLKAAIKAVKVGDDEYSLLVNLKRLYELQLKKNVVNEDLYDDLAGILRDVLGFVLLNMYLQVAWSLCSIDSENPSEVSLTVLLSKRTNLFEQLEHIMYSLVVVHEERRRTVLPFRVSIILAEMWNLFRKSKYASTTLESLGYYPDFSTVEKFWKLCQQILNISDETEEEYANEEYIEETNKDAVLLAASKLVINNAVSRDYLGPEIISHFVMHGTSTSEIIKHLITVLKKTSNDIPQMFLEAMKRAYQRHMEEQLKSNYVTVTGKSFTDCVELAKRLSGTFSGVARSKFRLDILKIVKDGISYAFVDAPKQLSFLEAAVIPFVSKLAASDILDILKDVKRRAENVNSYENPSGWRPYHTFIEHLHERYAKNEAMQDEGDGTAVRRRGRPRKVRNLEGKKLFHGEGSSGEDSISITEQNSQDDDDEEEQQPLIHSIKTSASKLKALRITQQQEARGQTGTSSAAGN